MNRALRAGDRIRDNDPRAGDRVLEIIDDDFSAVRVLAKDSIGAKFRILKSRIFCDGKRRKYGFNLVDGAQA